MLGNLINRLIDVDLIMVETNHTINIASANHLILLLIIKCV